MYICTHQYKLLRPEKWYLKSGNHVTQTPILTKADILLMYNVIPFEHHV